MSSDTRDFRLGILGVVAIALFGALLARLWFLQVLTSEDLAEAAESNRVRIVHEEAPRGRILDRQRRVLVDNRLAIQVTIELRRLDEAVDFDDDERREILQHLADELTSFGVAPREGQVGTTLGDLEEAIEHPQVDPLVPIPVIPEVPAEFADAVEVFLLENHDDFPGIGVERVTIRNYPYGALAAHVLGYVGEINPEQLEDLAGSPKPYQPGDEIGRAGVEATYEDTLRGQPGQRVYEVDAEGHIVRELTEESEAPVPGDDLMLSIDRDIQTLTEQSLAAVEPEAGSAVVMDPNNGAVLAMASYPTYNPADFVGGINPEVYEALTAEGSNFPLNNWAVQGQYAPGSTFKIVTAAAAMREGLVQPEETFNDDGIYELQDCTGDCEFQNAGQQENGTVDMRRSLTVSSDWYYYRLGELFWLRRDDLGEDALQQVAEDFGFGRDTGIDLPTELSGVVPTPALKAERHDQYPEAFPFGQWFTGDNVITAIGQGDMVVTPLQLVNSYAALANGGTLYQPHVGASVLRPDDLDLENPEWRELRTIEPEVLSEIDLPPEIRDPILAGLVEVPRAEDGTARAAFEGFDAYTWPVCGKTGTAQVTGQERDNALFVGFGPCLLPNQPPQYVAGAVLQNAGFGGDVAAPIVRRIFEGIQHLGEEGYELPPPEIVPADPSDGGD